MMLATAALVLATGTLPVAGTLPIAGILPVAGVATDDAPRAQLQRVWSATVGSARGAPITALHVAGSHLLAADGLGGVSALSLSDGTLDWFVDLGAPLEFASQVTAGKLALSVGDHLVVVDADSGRRAFDRRLVSPVVGGAVCDGERVYVPLLLDDALAAYDLASGRRLWSMRMPAAFAAPLQAVTGGTLVVCLEDGTLRGIRPGPDSARETWVRRADHAIGTPVVEGGGVWLATTGRSLVSLDGASGRVLWTHRSPDRLVAAPVRAGGLWLQPTEVGLAAVRGCPEGSAQGCRPAVVWTRPVGESPLGGAGELAVVRDVTGRTVLRTLVSGQTVARAETVGAPVGAWWPIGGRRVAAIEPGGLVVVWMLAR